MRTLFVPIAATTAVQTLVSMTVFSPALLAPAAQHEIGVGAAAIGIFTAIIYVAATLTAPLGGALVRRFGPLRISQQCLLWSGAGLALFASAVPAIVALGGLMIGVGYGPITPASSTILIRRIPERWRNLMMSIRQSGVTIGGAIAGALVPMLILSLGWRAAALLVTAGCVLLALALQPLREEYDLKREPHHPIGGTSYPELMRMVFRHPELRRIALTSLTYSGIQLCLASYLVIFLVDRAGLTLVSAGAAFSAAMISGIFARILWGVAADFLFSGRVALGILGILMALCAFAITQVTAQWSYTAIVVLCVVFGGSAIGWNGVFVAEIARVAPKGQVAQATGAVLGLTYFGVVLTPFAFWIILATSSSYSLAFTLVGTLTLVSGISYFRPLKPAHAA
jgi:MFS family permease